MAGMGAEQSPGNWYSGQAGNMQLASGPGWVSALNRAIDLPALASGAHFRYAS